MQNKNTDNNLAKNTLQPARHFEDWKALKFYRLGFQIFILR